MNYFVKDMKAGKKRFVLWLLQKKLYKNGKLKKKSGMHTTVRHDAFQFDIICYLSG